MRKCFLLTTILFALSLAFAACSEDEPEQKPQKPNAQYKELMEPTGPLL